MTAKVIEDLFELLEMVVDLVDAVTLVNESRLAIAMSLFSLSL